MEVSRQVTLVLQTPAAAQEELEILLQGQMEVLELFYCVIQAHTV